MRGLNSGSEIVKRETSPAMCWGSFLEKSKPCYRRCWSGPLNPRKFGLERESPVRWTSRTKSPSTPSIGKQMSKKNIGLYEGMYVLSSVLSDDARKKVWDKIVAGITDKGGKVQKQHDMGRRKLAYEIEGKKEGYYYVLFFEAPTSIIAELWKEYHLVEDLIRFLTM